MCPGWMLFEAHAADQIPYIEQLAEYWGELCGSRELASEWADRLINITRLALSPDRATRGFFHGTSACLSALFAAGRHDELIGMVQSDVLWTYKRWAVKALAAQGRGAEAIEFGTCWIQLFPARRRRFFKPSLSLNATRKIDRRTIESPPGCPLHQACAWVRTRFSRCLAKAAWERCGRPATRGWTGLWPSSV